MNWVCDECGDVSENEHDPCACDPDVIDRRHLIAELRRLRDENKRLRHRLADASAPKTP